MYAVMVYALGLAVYIGRAECN